MARTKFGVRSSLAKKSVISLRSDVERLAAIAYTETNGGARSSAKRIAGWSKECGHPFIPISSPIVAT